MAQPVPEAAEAAVDIIGLLRDHIDTIARIGDTDLFLMGLEIGALSRMAESLGGALCAMCKPTAEDWDRVTPGSHLAEVLARHPEAAHILILMRNLEKPDA